MTWEESSKPHTMMLCADGSVMAQAEPPPWWSARHQQTLDAWLATPNAATAATKGVSLNGLHIRVEHLEGSTPSTLLRISKARHPREARDLGVTSLNGRRRVVAEYAAAGATAREIANALELSYHTVRAYLRDVYRQLGVSNRVELANALEGLAKPTAEG